MSMGMRSCLAVIISRVQEQTRQPTQKSAFLTIIPGMCVQVAVFIIWTYFLILAFLKLQQEIKVVISINQSLKVTQLSHPPRRAYNFIQEANLVTDRNQKHDTDPKPMEPQQPLPKIRNQDVDQNAQSSSSQSQQSASSPHEPGQPSQQLSKNQLKKLKKRQLWEEAKRIKKIKKKEQKKLNKLNQVKPAVPVVSILQQPRAMVPIVNQKKRKQDYIEKMAQGLRVVIDMQFYSEMTQKEKNSLCKQLQHCHSTNRKMEKPCCLMFTSVTNEFNNILCKKHQADCWGLRIEEKNMTDIFATNQLVYLTGDAEEDIIQFEQEQDPFFDLIYHRRNRGPQQTQEDHLQLLQRFPLGNYVQLKSNAHLAVNHIFEMLARVYNGADWGTTIQEVIPQRKVLDKQEHW